MAGGGGEQEDAPVPVHCPHEIPPPVLFLLLRTINRTLAVQISSSHYTLILPSPGEGEAHHHVHSQTDRPFHVQTGDDNSITKPLDGRIKR